MTPSENKKKAAKNTDYSFTNYNYINKKSIKAINLMTDEVHYFPSMYSVQVELGVSTGVVKKIVIESMVIKGADQKLMIIGIHSSI